MYNDYNAMKAKALKDYDSAIREINMWESLENQLIRAKKEGFIQFGFRADKKVLPLVENYIKKLTELLLNYGYEIFKIEVKDDKFTVYCKVIDF